MKDKMLGYFIVAVLRTGTTYRKIGLGAIECHFVVKAQNRVLLVPNTCEKTVAQYPTVSDILGSPERCD